MSVSVNILHFKVNSMTNNASIVIGNGYHNSHSVEEQNHGNMTAIGDEGTIDSKLENYMKDTALIDQSEFENSDNIYVGKNKDDCNERG
ncbi:MAG: spore germination protein [Tuberibacillus sp.]